MISKGFTLIELVLVILITSVIGLSAASFVRLMEPSLNLTPQVNEAVGASTVLFNLIEEELSVSSVISESSQKACLTTFKSELCVFDTGRLIKDTGVDILIGRVNLSPDKSPIFSWVNLGDQKVLQVTIHILLDNQSVTVQRLFPVNMAIPQQGGDKDA